MKREGIHILNIKMKRMLLILVIWLVFAGDQTVQGKTDDVIHFNDKNLEKAICSEFDCEAPITKKIAHKLSQKNSSLHLSKSDITDIEGLQYFDGLIHVDLSYNKITNLHPLSKLPDLRSLDVSNYQIKGQELENILNGMGKIEHLDSFDCNNNAIKDLSFLKNIGNTKNYTHLRLSFNIISDISILKECKSLEYLYLENNRISDFAPIKNLKNEYPRLFLYDNCMIDLKPIKPLFDRMFDGQCGGDLTERSDFYENSVNLIYQNKEIHFPHLTVYYMLQAYAEAVPLIEALGGSASYDKATGILTCNIYGKELIIKDFSYLYTLNGVDKYMSYEMRRMQYDTAYVPVKDLCNILGLNYKVLKERILYNGDGEDTDSFPEFVEISECKVSDRTKDYKYEITDNQVGIIKYLGTETNVIIPAQINGLPVTYIEDGAFCNDSNLSSVEIPDTVTRIGTRWGEEGVFTGCYNLVSVKLNEGKEAASIGASAFLNCQGLSSIEIPRNYKIIYESAFNNCISLKSLTISEGVERIDAGAFASEDALESVTLPSTIKALGYKYDADIITDPSYINQTGVFYSCKSLKQVSILEGSQDAYIGAYTFSECPKLKSIIIPGNYRAICEKAFMNCFMLKSIVYEKSRLDVEAYQIIEQNVFEGCKKLKEVSLSESLKSIGDYAFTDCTRLKEIIIPEGVTKIGKYAFSDTSLESVTIPSTVTLIGSSMDDCYEGSTFNGCKKLVNVSIKEGTKDAKIGAGTFRDCIKLERIIIPGNFITIGEEAFSNCTALKSVIYKNNSNPLKKQKILTYAFLDCKSLLTVELPSTLTLLEYRAFGSCTKLRTVSIPTGVNKLTIDDFVFQECPSLSMVYIGENVKCNYCGLSLTLSKANIYTFNKTVKKLAISDELNVFSPASDYINGTTLFGTIDIIGTNEVGSILTANIDAVAPINASISYKWSIDGKTVGTERTYEVKSNNKGKTIKLTITGINGYTGHLSKTINNKKVNTVRYDGYYYFLNESDNTLDIFKFFPDGKVINDIVKLSDKSKLTDKSKRNKFFDKLEKWFNYNYKGGFGYIEANNSNIYFNITYYEDGDYNGEVAHIGVINKKSLDLVVISHRSDYCDNLTYGFVKE